MSNTADDSIKYSPHRQGSTDVSEQTPRTDAVSNMAVGPHREKAILDFTRQLEHELSAAQAQAEQGESYSDGYRRILIAIENLDEHEYTWRDLVAEIRQIANAEYQKRPLVSRAAIGDDDAKS
ncbi:MAG: hypothetical protein NUV75_02045 [Gallionella sp.]|nr:hypothetical protein [Gallionella sp.]